MKIAIHHSDLSFSHRWIQYCNDREIDVVIVDAFKSSIIDDLKDVQFFLWHWNHGEASSFLIARQLIRSIEMLGVKVYPNIDTCWHYDDKVGQKYLLEAINAPLVPSYVFFDQKAAKNWAKRASFPKVFKLRGGFGSNNVKLVRSLSEADSLISTAFGKGFSQFNYHSLIRDRIYKFQQNKSIDTFKGIIKGLGRFFFKKDLEKILGREFGYVYFQDFIPDCSYDTRLIVVGEKCFGFRRFNRDNDFRASGSGLVDFDKNFINIDSVKSAFAISRNLNTQSLAFDFIYDSTNKGKIVEISYCFGVKASSQCPGYWNSEIEWVEGNINIQDCIISDLLN